MRYSHYLTMLLMSKSKFYWYTQYLNNCIPRESFFADALMTVKLTSYFSHLLCEVGDLVKRHNKRIDIRVNVSQNAGLVFQLHVEWSSLWH